MNRNGGTSPIRVPKLLMRAALAGYGKSQFFQNGNDYSRFQNRDVAHVQLTVTV